MDEKFDLWTGLSFENSRHVVLQGVAGPRADEVKKLGRKKLVMAALWTEVCLLEPTLSAIDQGYDVDIVTDASGGVTKEAHDMAVQRMVRAGARPMTHR